jgi:hypothetical protein
MKAYFDETSLHHSAGHPAFVGAAEGCDLLILIFQDQGQKIAAFGSSYRDRGVG